MDLPEVIFLDTSALLALYNNEDAWNEEASYKLKKRIENWDKFVTTDYVISETYTGLLGFGGYKIVVEFDRDFKSGLWQVEKINEERFGRAREIFMRFNKDKEWSFVDCSSFVIMKELKIKKVFTYDKDFEQMGFEVL